MTAVPHTQYTAIAFECAQESLLQVQLRGRQHEGAVCRRRADALARLRHRCRRLHPRVPPSDPRVLQYAAGVVSPSAKPNSSLRTSPLPPQCHVGLTGFHRCSARSAHAVTHSGQSHRPETSAHVGTLTASSPRTHGVLAAYSRRPRRVLTASSPRTIGRMRSRCDMTALPKHTSPTVAAVLYIGCTAARTLPRGVARRDDALWDGRGRPHAAVRNRCRDGRAFQQERRPVPHVPGKRRL